ncbi:hypothetical protein AAMO2058_000576200 [Amorphochlora amoebiformis]
MPRSARFDPTAHAKKLAERKARAAKIRAEREAKKAELERQRAEREAKRRSQYGQLSSSSNPFGEPSADSGETSTSTMHGNITSNSITHHPSAPGPRSSVTAERGGRSDPELRSLVQKLESRIDALEAKVSRQQSQLEDLSALENRQFTVERKIQALERENALLKRQIKTTSAGGAMYPPGGAIPTASTARTERKISRPKLKPKPKPKAMKPKPPMSFDDVPVGGSSGNSPFSPGNPPSFDDTPIGRGSSKPKAVVTNLDEIPVGGGAKKPVDFDDMPVGGGGKVGPQEIAVGGSGSGGLPPGLDPFAPSEPVELKQCPYCSRKFKPKALKTHIKLKICRKKRKAFKSSLIADELKGELKEAKRNNRQSSKEFEKRKKKEAKKVPKWKRDRDALREAMKAGKMMQQALAAGKSLADLPPPTSSVPDDRVACKLCGRKFNEDRIKKHMDICKKINGKKKVKKSTRLRR